MTGGDIVTTAPDAEATLLNIISRAASDPATDVDKLERLMGLYERHQANEAHRLYTAAMAEMQPQLPEIEEHGEIKGRDGSVQSTYAKWEDVQAAIKPILAAHGFALTFAVDDADGAVMVTAKLSHRGGHVEQTTKRLPLDSSGSKNLVQSHGSTTSYGMRYTARALLNLTSRGEDDDGQAGGAKLISEGELEALRLLIAQGKFDEQKFCATIKVASLDQLPAQRYRQAERTLQDALAKQRERAVERTKRASEEARARKEERQQAREEKRLANEQPE